MNTVEGTDKPQYVHEVASAGTSSDGGPVVVLPTELREDPPNPPQVTQSQPPIQPSPGQAVVISYPNAEKSLLEAYLLWVILGFFGAHHFYLKRPGFGVVYAFTFGLAGFGYLVDAFRLPWLVHEYNKNEKGKQPGEVQAETKSISDAYVLWFPFGLFGFHHFYLRRHIWGLAYLFTVGFFGIGWLIDLVRIPVLVKAKNEKINREFESDGVREKKLGEAFLLAAIPPLGLLGAHHYYLERYGWGMLYTFTLGLFGCGWLFDLCRMWLLVERTNALKKEEVLIKEKHYDDAYCLWLPLGFLGLHHFYLNRPAWGFLYLFTCGLFGIGWLVDMCRIPFLVRDANEKIATRTVLTAVVTEGKVMTLHPHSSGNVAITVNHPPGVTCPGQSEAWANTQPGVHGPLSLQCEAQQHGPGGSSGVILQPPSYVDQQLPGYVDQQPPSYDETLASIASSDVGHENHGFSPLYPPIQQDSNINDQNSMNEGLEKPPL